MRSFTRQCGAHLALIALALQLALSFGHLHSHDIFPSGIALAKTHTAGSWQSPSNLADDDDLCPICFSGSLLATSFVPSGPEPPVAFTFQRSDRLVLNTIELVAAIRRTPIQPRAPPHA